MKRSTAQQNIAKLPEWCYSLNLTNQNLVIVRAGESGFYPFKQPREWDLKGRTIDQYINDRNAERGVTKAMRMAMDVGSCFGWEADGADMDIYNKD